MFKGKKYVDSAKLIDKSMQYEVADAMDLVVKSAKAKFDETVEIHIKLGVDSRHADQQVRGAIVLPNGTGKTRLYPEAYRLGRAGGVCRAALAAGETVPAAQLIPDYHRLSQAERERAARLQAAP